MVNAPRRIALLGATGSIGGSTLDVVAQSEGAFVVESMAAGRDVQGLAAAARRSGAKFAAIRDADLYADLKAALSGSGIEAAAGEDSVVEAALRPADVVVGAIAGTAGLAPTFAALEAGRTIALANKECLVCAGGAFMRAARERGVTVLPLDSEHDALWQSMAEAPARGIEKWIITASGGPFRTWDAERIATARPEEALKHPNWSMGRKVTIDSASMMNKGLELIEARHLFDVPPERLEVLVHPQSIVHGMVQFVDGSVVASLYAPDMRVPIAHCLGYPHRLKTDAARLDLAQVGALTFERPDLDRFPALGIAMEAMRRGGAAPTVMNAANEVAVAAFLEGRVAFGEIPKIVAFTLEKAEGQGLLDEPGSVEAALAVDHISRQISAAYWP